jgi:hypothetical protein
MQLISNNCIDKSPARRGFFVLGVYENTVLRLKSPALNLGERRVKTIKTILWTLAAVFLMLLAIGIYMGPPEENSVKTIDKQDIVNVAPKPEEPPVVATPAIKIEKTADLTMTPNELVRAEHKNKARFIRDIVGKNVKITGKVKSISESFFNFEATEGLSGEWPVYGKSQEFLANLEAGQTVTIICEIEDELLFGGVSRCTD